MSQGTTVTHMKSLTSLAILFVVVSVSCAQQTVDEQIKLVESGLSGPLKLKGEKSRTIEQRMKHYGVPGVSVAVVKDNKVAWTRAWGVKDKETGEPVTTDTLFQCASISKPFSAAAALRLVEQGKFDLKSDINTFLDSWKLPDNKFTKQQHVTLEHLISHTAGLTVHGFLGYGNGLAVPTLKELLDGKSPANSDPIRVDKTPGGKFRYSGGGYCIMQQMMIDAMQKPYPEIMNELVLGPLQMNKSTFAQPLPTNRHAEAATGYLPGGKTVSGKRHTYPEIAPAGLYTTASELAGFFIEMQLAYHGKSNRVLSQTMAKRMMTVDKGLGIGIDDHDGEVYIGHSGWNEGFTSDADFHRDRGYGIVVLTNSNKPRLIDEIISSVAQVYGWHNRVTPEYEKIALDPDAAKPMIGRYNYQGSPYRFAYNMEKFWLYTDSFMPAELIPVAENKFICRDIELEIEFVPASSDERAKLSFKKPWATQAQADEIASQMTDNEKLPVEWISEGDFEKALEEYQQLKKDHPNARAVSEQRINTLGYQLLGIKKVDKAIEIFRVNTSLYPEAFNVWDSLGEAYMNKGESLLAIQNYEKSLELNPGNTGAREMIEKIKADAARK